MTLAQKLALKYEKLSGHPFPGGPEHAVLVRTYAGRWQKAAGAVTFYLASGTGTPVIGSLWKARDCLRRAVSIYDPGHHMILEFVPTSPKESEVV